MDYKFSIITPSYNHSAFIKDTIESVLNQRYENFEHIIIDGGSNDGTVDILKSFPHLQWVSEKDNGSADAINKGFSKATGDVFGWINSDDYYDENVFRKVCDIFKNNPDVELIIGDLTYIDVNHGIILKDKTYNFDLNYLLNSSADVVRQPGTFFRKSLFDKAGYLNTKLKYVFDFELFIRFLKITKTLLNIVSLTQEICAIMKNWGIFCVIFTGNHWML